MNGDDDSLKEFIVPSEMTGEINFTRNEAYWLAVKDQIFKCKNEDNLEEAAKIQSWLLEQVVKF